MVVSTCSSILWFGLVSARSPLACTLGSIAGCLQDLEARLGCGCHPESRKTEHASIDGTDLRRHVPIVRSVTYTYRGGIRMSLKKNFENKSRLRNAYYPRLAGYPASRMIMTGSNIFVALTKSGSNWLLHPKRKEMIILEFRVSRGEEQHAVGTTW